MAKLQPGPRAALFVTALLCGGCTLDSVVAQAGLPGTSISASVSDVAQRGAYLDARIVAGGFDFRLFFPASETCRFLLEDPVGLRFKWLGVIGRISNDVATCDAVGILSLRAWRDRRPRGAREPLPRAPARYEVVYRDADLAQLRGRFPLARALGFSGSMDLIVVVPNDEVCNNVMRSGTASMEFRASGPKPLVLLDGKRFCLVLGLAYPQS